MITKEIFQEISFKANPQEVYDAYMNEDFHALFTNAEAEIEPVAGGNFSAYGGYATGKMKLLVPAKRIVQSWQAEEEGWPKNHFSEIDITLEKNAEGCFMKFLQTEVPQSCHAAIAQGWFDYYWEPLKKYFEGKE